MTLDSFRRRSVGLVLVGLLAGCTTPPPPPIEVLNAELTPNPSGNAPLTALCTFSTETPTRATITVNYGGSTRTFEPEKDFAIEHAVPVLYLKPATSHEIVIEVEDETGNTGRSQPLTLTTGALPPDLPPIEVAISQPERMEPGVTFIPLMKWPRGQVDEQFGLMIAVDDKGEVVWIYRSNHSITELKRLANGNIAYMPGRDGRLVEIDMLGNIVRRWHTTGVPKKDIPEDSIPVETDTFHHDFIQIPNGNFMTLSTEVREFENYPTSETDPDAPRETQKVIGDVLIEFQPEDGKIVRSWKLLDVLDPYRISYGSLSTGFWTQVYKDVLEKPGKDWAHCNALFYLPEDDDIILSFYNQDCVIRFDLGEGKIKWISGDHAGWKEPWQPYLLKPKGDLLWHYHQHGPKVTPRGTIIMFDNGTNRAIAPAPRVPRGEAFSRAVEYKIDESTMEIEQVWHYGGPDGERFFSSFICDVDWLPTTGNVLVTDGGRVRRSDGTDADQPFGGKHWARIVEVTHTTPPEKVFELIIEDEELTGWAIYRSERMPSLYP